MMIVDRKSDYQSIESASWELGVPSLADSSLRVPRKSTQRERKKPGPAAYADLERYARKCLRVWSDENAWLKTPLPRTAKQEALLRSFGAWRKRLSRSEASQLIDYHFTRRRLQASRRSAA